MGINPKIVDYTKIKKKKIDIFQYPSLHGASEFNHVTHNHHRSHGVIMPKVGAQGRSSRTCSLPVRPSSLSPGQIPKIDPTEKLASMMEEPSRGSNPTEYMLRKQRTKARNQAHTRYTTFGEKTIELASTRTHHLSSRAGVTVACSRGLISNHFILCTQKKHGVLTNKLPLVSVLSNSAAWQNSREKSESPNKHEMH